MTDGASVQRLIPEILLVLGASALFVGSAFRTSATVLSLMGRAIILLAVLFMAGPGSLAKVPLDGVIQGDPLSLALRWIALAAAAIFVYGSGRSQGKDALEGERLGSILLVFTGCMLVGSAADLTMLFVGLELVSIPTYGLLFLGQRTAATSEATIKYFLLSIFSSAFFLLGLAWIYQMTGTTSLQSTATQGFLVGHGWTGLLPWAMLFVLVGMGFKLAAFPMQFYAPDVYQGVSHLNAGLLSVAPKLAGIAGLLRLLQAWGPEYGTSLLVVFLLTPIVTMTLGNVGALWQKQIRRLFAYSSIAHGGYLLMGMAVLVAGGWVDGTGAVLLYLLVYAIASLGLFCGLSGMRSANGAPPEHLDELSGLLKRDPWLALALSVFMFSLAGIPPLAGFWGKLGLFSGVVSMAQFNQDHALLSPGFIALAVIGALNAAVAAAYYLRVVGIVCFREPIVTEAPRGEALPRQVALLCAVVLIGMGCFPQAFITGFRSAARPAMAQEAVSQVVLPVLPSR